MVHVLKASIEPCIELQLLLRRISRLTRMPDGTNFRAAFLNQCLPHILITHFCRCTNKLRFTRHLVQRPGHLSLPKTSVGLKGNAFLESEAEDTNIKSPIQSPKGVRDFCMRHRLIEPMTCFLLESSANLVNLVERIKWRIVDTREVFFFAFIFGDDSHTFIARGLLYYFISLFKETCQVEERVLDFERSLLQVAQVQKVIKLTYHQL